MQQYEFSFGDEVLEYFSHPYNNTRHNERAIEIPIFMHYIKEMRNSGVQAILEIGNVLSHYYLIPHVTVDKYEKCQNVINEDYLDFKTDQKFDFIFSISTIEHVGLEDKSNNPERFKDFIQKTKELLSPSGWSLVSFPLGYNTALDKELKENPDLFTTYICMKRGKYNEWSASDIDWDSNYGAELVDVGSIKDASFVKRFHTHVVFGIITNREIYNE